MIKKIKLFLIRFLPDWLVRVIRLQRRSYRIKKRFLINNGNDILKSVVIGDDSFSIYINPYLNGGVDNDIYILGGWEPEIEELINKYLPKGGTFIDIGANIGYHTLYAACIVGETGKVVAFEPLPRLYEQMKKSVVKNSFSQVTLHNVGLSDKNMNGRLSLVDENIGASSLMEVSDVRAVSNIVDVSLKTLDSYINDFTQLNFIKIDIEGSEYEALKGGERLIEKYMPVIVLEFSPGVYEKEFSGKSLEIFLYLKKIGYNIAVIGNPGLDIERKLRDGDYGDLHTNFLCLPVTHK